TVILTCWIVTELLSFILIKIEFHSRPLSVESHAKKERDYPIRVLISIVPSYTTEARTRAHAFVVMLAYQIIHYLAACWSPFDLTAEEGLHALTTLCLVEVSPHNAPTITVSLRLVTLSRAYCTAPTSSSQRSSPFLAHRCPRRKNSNQNDLACEFSDLTGS